MAAPLGNTFWMKRHQHGRKKLYRAPAELWTAAVEYMQDVENSPLPEVKVFHHKGFIKEHTVYHMRPMTISGMCVYLNIDEQTWRNYKEDKDKLGFFGICTQVEKIIYNQKLAGATANLMNPVIIARELGLKDHTDHSSEDGSMSPPKSFNDFYADQKDDDE